MRVENRNISIVEIFIEGLIQGVGFRPYVYRLAHKYGLQGWVKNQNDGVKILLLVSESILVKFVNDLHSAPPPIKITSVVIQDQPLERLGFNGFKILKSENKSDQVTLVSPDIAVCEQCLKDIKSQRHRNNYPLVNCTHCGPRFTIIKDLPYDRSSTTMDDFSMCPQCAEEYRDIADRRFHAQPIACNNCGPIYQLKTSNLVEKNINKILNRCAQLLQQGKVIAVKGQGGYHLACNAFDNDAVKKLRKIKLRDKKPFAVMFASLEHLRIYAKVNHVEAELLQSWQRPIVLLQQLLPLASGINDGIKELGVMLPYMPFHYLLFEKLDTPAIVLTSGNLSDDPILIDDALAWQSFEKTTGAIVSYNRNIYNRTDDSVMMVANRKTRMIRRSRGYVPIPEKVAISVDGIVATGAELNNCFCLGKGSYAYLSQHIGDLKNFQTFQFFSESLNRFLNLFRVQPELIVHDLHPDYLSTRFAREYGVPAIAVQHHHAHLAACMGEHNLDEKVIGVIMDGTGYGLDGNIWGSEFITGDLMDFQRRYHFQYLPLAGGDKAVYEPWRTAVAYLWLLKGKHFCQNDFQFLQHVSGSALDILLAVLQKGINCPLSCSAGRVFDAVAALLNVCTQASYHAEAPMRLESLATVATSEFYDFGIIENEISWQPAFSQMIEDLHNKEVSSLIATRFHNTMVAVVRRVVQNIREDSGLKKVILSGGLFQNRYLLEKLENKLELDGFEIYTPVKFPANDGGLALGQLLIAAKRRALCV